MRRVYDCLEYLLIVGTLICCNIIFSTYFFRIDFTEDKRHSLAPVTKNILSSLESDLYVDVYLSGTLNSDFERLRKAIQEKLDQCKAYSNRNITYRFIDPSAEPDKIIRERFQNQIYKRGITPHYYLDESNGSKTERLLFPGLILTYKNRETPVSFLKGNKTLSIEEQLNQSVEGVEYEILQGLRRLSTVNYKTITLIDGHGEPAKEKLLEISNALTSLYKLQRRKLDSLNTLKGSDVVILINPTVAFTEKEKYILDQYVVNGGRLFVLLDQADIRKDSLKNGVTFGLEKQLNLNDLFFKYGIRLNQNAVSDINCATTVIQTGLNGEVQALSFPYYPIIYEFSDHVITKNLDAIKLVLAGTIDTVKSENIKKTVLLTTSSQSKILNVPFQIDLDFLKRTSDPSSYQAGKQIVGVLLEGKFTSLYKNKPSPWGVPASDTNTTSNGKIIVYSDADLILNEMDTYRNKPIALGYDKDMRYQFSSKDLILNSIDYLMNQEVIEVRSKEVVMRPLDVTTIQSKRFFWQFLNIALPILIVVSFAVYQHLQRKKKFGSF